MKTSRLQLCTGGQLLVRNDASESDLAGMAVAEACRRICYRMGFVIADLSVEKMVSDTCPCDVHASGSASDKMEAAFVEGTI